MQQSNYLRSLLTPASVAIIGASSKPGSVGRIVLENMLGGGFHGALFVVNPAHRRVLAQRSYSSLVAIGKPVELALIAAPFDSVPAIMVDCARAGVKAAVVLSLPPPNRDEAKKWHSQLRKSAANGVRILGPHSFGVIRTDIGLNATLGTTVAHAGKLALIAQSGAVCAAMLDFAASAGIGFSTVAALGGAIDVGFGELLDALVADSATDGILIYAETVGDARQFLSALRAAARTKPVVVLKAGRSMERITADVPSHDAVFDAAMRRAGTVRVKSYAQLFGVARLLAMHRASRGDRLAIVSNGHGPGLLAADSASDRGIPLAKFSPATERALANVLGTEVLRHNPIDLGRDVPSIRLAGTVEAILNDDQVDAVLVLRGPQPFMGATDAARAVASVARRATKPVLSVWLGAVNRPEAADALEAGGVANFYTPEHAVEAFSFLAAYRHHQQWLLEVPPPQPEPHPPDLRVAERIPIDAAADKRVALTEMELHALLSTFGLPLSPQLSAETLAEVVRAAKRLGYPVSLRAEGPVQPLESPPVAHERLRNGKMLSRAWAALAAAPTSPRLSTTVVVRKEYSVQMGREFAIGVHRDPVFGPVITIENAGASAGARRDPVVLLPPLNLSLARDLIRDSPVAAVSRGLGATANVTERLAHILVQVSALVCALPWVRSLLMSPVRFSSDRVEIVAASVEIDPRGGSARGYGHMAIHPYPIELVADVTLADGTMVHVRPIRPEDAELEQKFVAGVSDETRYFRFFYQLNELTPAMLARFTQIDYDREMALVAVDESSGTPAFVSVARYILTPDRESAEFAIVVTDAWQRRGVARMLMAKLVACARSRGLKRLEGTVLRNNQHMLRFAESLGFTSSDNPDDPEQVSVALDLSPRPRESS